MDIRVSSVSCRELCCLPGHGATRLVGLALACPKSMTYSSQPEYTPTEMKVSGGLQECADVNVSKADAHSAARTQRRS